MKIDHISSVLKMNDLYVRRCSFERNPGDFENFELEISMDKSIEPQDNGSYDVILEMQLTNGLHEFTMEITVVGNFEVDAPAENIKNELLEKNTVAILFPYLRAQITLLSSQPGMKPIVIPPVNVNALTEKMSEEGPEDSE